MASDSVTNAPIDEEERFEAPLPAGRWGRVMAFFRRLFRRSG
jgi:hypothetical protein